jgi:hypothetical protein
MEIKKLIAVATGEIHHIYNGLCPDSQTGPGSRDAECPACKILTDAAAKHDEMVCRVRQVEALQHRIVELEAEVESSEEMKTLRFCEGEWATEREALMRRLRTAESEAVKSERRAIEYGDIVHQFTIAMRAALVAAHLDGLDHGMQWIYNTLAGPGHLPDLDDARALGGAQAMFDAEMAEHKAFRVAHPAPAIQSPKVGDCTEVKPS